MIDPEGTADNQYMKTTRQLFNSATIENALKWNKLEATPGDEDPVAKVAINWLVKNDLTMRGHNLVWPAWRHCPDQLEKYRDNPQKISQIILQRIERMLSRYENSIARWDIVNEPFSCNELFDVLGKQEEVISSWILHGRKISPKTDLVINDYGMEAQNPDGHIKRQYYIELLRKLKAKNAMPDGIGLQGHFSGRLPSPGNFYRSLEELARTGVRLEITEFDIDTDNEKLQADFTRDIMTMAFSHPAVDGFTFWGFWGGRHWRKNAAMYREDWTPKPAAGVYTDLLFNQWGTSLTGKTSHNGKFTFRGFKGLYRISVTTGDTTIERIVNLVQDTDVEISLEPNQVEGLPLITPDSANVLFCPIITTRP